MPQNITPAISISCVRTVHIHRIWEKSSVLFCDISFYLRLFYFRVLTGKINPLLHQLILQPEPGHQFLKHGSLAGQLLVGAVISVFPPQIIFSHPPYKGQFSKDSCSGKLFKLFLFYQLKIGTARHFYRLASPVTIMVTVQTCGSGADRQDFPISGTRLFTNMLFDLDGHYLKIKTVFSKVSQ